MVTDDWFERFFSDTLRDDAAIRRFLTTVPDDEWSHFHNDAAAHITAALERPGLPAGAPGDMDYGSLHIITPHQNRIRAPWRRRWRLLAEEDQRRRGGR